jgi:hypothetical protein
MRAGCVGEVTVVTVAAVQEGTEGAGQEGGCCDGQ